MRWQRDIDSGPDGVGPTEFIYKSRARVKRAAVLMNGNEQGVGIVPVNILGPVAMMAIGVHNGNFIDRVSLPEIFNHDGFDIDIAKSACSVDNAHGMMAGWSHQRKAALNLFVHDCHPDGLGTAGTDKM